MIFKKLAVAFAALSPIFLATSVFGQGALTPPGAPAPTMKTLSQIEPRTPISSAPFIITNSGSYYLTTNLVVSAGDAIDINTNEVTLDLNGFSISSTSASPGGTAIYILSRTNVAIFNGHIRGGVTNNGSGTFSGPGFLNGIYETGGSYDVQVSHLTVSGCEQYGIVLSSDTGSFIESCSADSIGTYGLYADTVTRSTAINFGNTGIFGYTVSDCYANGAGLAVEGYYSVNNCAGISLTSEGIYSVGGVNNCSGKSSSGYGMIATSVFNSYGYSGGSASGIEADEVMNSEGYGYSGTGIFAEYTACNSFGNSYTGTGLYALVANGCYGASTSGTAENVTHKYNMP